MTWIRFTRPGPSAPWTIGLTSDSEPLAPQNACQYLDLDLSSFESQVRTVDAMLALESALIAASVELRLSTQLPPLPDATTQNLAQQAVEAIIRQDASQPPPVFVTPTSQAVTTGASGITNSGAVLNGEINPNGQPTTYHFEWGLDASYGNVMPSPDQAVSDDFSTHEVSQVLVGLAASTVYHFRIVGTNGYGVTYGDDNVFTTGT